MHFCGFNYEQHSHRMTGNKVMTDHQILYLSILSFLFHFLRQTHYVVQDGSELIFFSASTGVRHHADLKTFIFKQSPNSEEISTK